MLYDMLLGFANDTVINVLCNKIFKIYSSGHG